MKVQMEKNVIQFLPLDKRYPFLIALVLIVLIFMLSSVKNSLKESKVTWKNYKNRKKILA